MGSGRYFLESKMKSKVQKYFLNYFLWFRSPSHQRNVWLVSLGCINRSPSGLFLLCSLNPQASLRCSAENGRIAVPGSALLDGGETMAGKKDFEGLRSESMMSMLSEIHRCQVPAIDLVKW